MKTIWERAGATKNRHSRAGGNPIVQRVNCSGNLDSRLRGNDEFSEDSRYGTLALAGTSSRFCFKMPADAGLSFSLRVK
jgi:hypothetical protein